MRNAITALMLALATPALAAEMEDPHLWLEDIEGDRAIAWVKERNARSLPELESVAGFEGWRTRAREILEDPRRLALPTGAGPSGVTATRVFNFWRDAKHVRGIWRVSPRAAFDAGAPEWTTLLDIDRLEAEEGRNWQWGGATCLAPDHRRCLVRLSVGGKDSVEVREFDTEAGLFVPLADNAFRLPDSKQQIAWLDENRLLVATAAGPVTTSGYAREVRLWERGTPFASATLVAEGAETEMGMYPGAYGTGANRRAIVDRRLTFWTSRISHLQEDGTLIDSPLPEDADFRFIATLAGTPRAFALLRSDWNGIPKGSLVAYIVPASGAPGPVERVFTPSPTQAIRNVDATGEALYLHLLDNVAARLVRIAPEGWATTDIPLPANSALTLQAKDAADTLYYTVASFTAPDTLYRSTSGTPAKLAEAPAHFDGSRFEVSQRFATSKDGTRVPYFLVRPKNARGPLRTLFFAYGGFEIPMVPAYPSPDIQFWLEAGNQYVLGNIRGGGEFGPAWHQAALRENRQRSYDDLHAIAEDLKQQKLASRLAVHGRSNGGLMASVAYTQRPDLYDAVMVGVPLADMRRYHLLLAGASWMGEYGNPDTADWDFIRAYSPYQAIAPDARYPRVFFYTSTKDDRVHPGHARKMAARMEELGHPFYYYENVDGGHAGVANLREAAYRSALFLAYLTRELK
ncbi:MAG: prolyl oligopeptidase family serine peptidase [Sphingomonadaceae bacterium]